MNKTSQTQTGRIKKISEFLFRTTTLAAGGEMRPRFCPYFTLRSFTNQELLQKINKTLNLEIRVRVRGFTLLSQTDRTDSKFIYSKAQISTLIMFSFNLLQINPLDFRGTRQLE